VDTYKNVPALNNMHSPVESELVPNDELFYNAAE
jgi:hypothetical protein